VDIFTTCEEHQMAGTFLLDLGVAEREAMDVKMGRGRTAVAGGCNAVQPAVD